MDNLNIKISKNTRRGRPPKEKQDYQETKEALIYAGMAILTEKGFSATGIDEILRSVNVPKGSFYHFFESKNTFGLELINRYADYYSNKLKRFLLDESLSPINRLKAFTEHALIGMARYDFRRGCLVGNLGQEMGHLEDIFRQRLIDVFKQWESLIANCLERAKQSGELPNTANSEWLAYCFWIGWEGAVLRAKLERSNEPLMQFSKFFFKSLSCTSTD